MRVASLLSEAPDAIARRLPMDRGSPPTPYYQRRQTSREGQNEATGHFTVHPKTAPPPA